MSSTKEKFHMATSPIKRVLALSGALAILATGLSVVPASASVFKGWTSISAETQALINHRTGSGLGMAESWQTSCSTNGNVRSTNGARGILASPVHRGIVSQPGYIRFSNAREEIVQEGEDTMHFYVVDVVSCLAPANAIAAPTKQDNDGPNDFVVIPSGASYSINGTPVSAGNIPVVHGAGPITSVTVRATPTAGELPPGTQTQWTLDFDRRSAVTATEPSFADNPRNLTDTVTIPSKAGVEYLIDGTVVAAGVHNVSGYNADGFVTKTVTARATDANAYTLSGTASWSRDFQNFSWTADVQAPTMPDGRLDQDTITVPNLEGLTYRINNTYVAAGSTSSVGTVAPYNAEGESNVTVTAQALTGYKIRANQTTTWTKEFLNYELTTIPTFTTEDKSGADNDTVTLPNIEGVTYTLNGAPVSAGTHNASGDIEIVSTTGDLYRFTDKTTEKTNNLTIDSREWTSPLSDPTFTDVEGRESDTLDLADLDGITWFVNGEEIAAGQHSIDSLAEGGIDFFTADVTYTIVDGYVLNPASTPSEWSNRYDVRRVVEIPEVTFTDVDGPNDQVVVGDADSDLVIQINGEDVQPGTHTRTNDVTVTVTAPTGVQFRGNEDKVVTFTQTFVSTYVADKIEGVTSNDEPGTGNDYYEIPSIRGIEFVINGEVIPAGRYQFESYTDNNASLEVLARPIEGFHPQPGETLNFTVSATERTVIAEITPVTFTDVVWANGSYTIPVQTGVEYFLVTADGEELIEGTHEAPYIGDVKIVARAIEGYIHTAGDVTFNHHFDSRKVVAPENFVVIDLDGTEDDAVVIPFTEGLKYFLNGNPVEAGLHKVTGDVVVTFEITDEEKYRLADGSEESFTATLSDGVAPVVTEVDKVRQEQAKEDAEKKQVVDNKVKESSKPGAKKKPAGGLAETGSEALPWSIAALTSLALGAMLVRRSKKEDTATN